MCISREAVFTKLFQSPGFVCCLERDGSRTTCHIDGECVDRLCGHENMPEAANPRIWVCILHR